MMQETTRHVLILSQCNNENLKNDDISTKMSTPSSEDGDDQCVSFMISDREILCRDEKRESKDFNSSSDPISCDSAIYPYQSLSEDDNEQVGGSTSNSDDERSVHTLTSSESAAFNGSPEMPLHFLVIPHKPFSMWSNSNNADKFESNDEGMCEIGPGKSNDATDGIGHYSRMSASATDLEKTFECSKCGQRFRSSNNFKHHLAECLHSTVDDNMFDPDQDSVRLRKPIFTLPMKRKFSDFDKDGNVDKFSHADNSDEFDENDKNNNEKQGDNFANKYRTVASNNDNDDNNNIDGNIQKPISRKNRRKIFIKDAKVKSEESTKKCPVCTFQMSTIAMVERHLRVNHPTYKAICNYCRAEFPSYQFLSCHENEEHATFAHEDEGKGSNIRKNSDGEFEPEQIYSCDLCKQNFKGLDCSVHKRTCLCLSENTNLFVTLKKFSHTPAETNINDDSPKIHFSSRLKEMLERNADEKINFLANINLRSVNDDRFDNMRKESFKKPIGDEKSNLGNIKGMWITPRLKELISTERSMLNLRNQENDDDAYDPFKSEVRNMKRRGEFPCRICKKVFRNLRALKGHARIHFSNHRGNSPYECNICPYSTSDKSAVIRHVRSHNGDHPYKCQLCYSTFTTKANCERHLRNAHRKTSREDIKRLLLDLNGKSQNTIGPPYKNPLPAIKTSEIPTVTSTATTATTVGRKKSVTKENDDSKSFENGLHSPFVLMYANDRDSKKSWNVLNSNTQQTFDEFGPKGTDFVKKSDKNSLIFNQNKFIISDDNNNSNSSGVFPNELEDQYDKMKFSQNSFISNHLLFGRGLRTGYPDDFPANNDVNNFQNNFQRTKSIIRVEESERHYGLDTNSIGNDDADYVGLVGPSQYQLHSNSMSYDNMYGSSILDMSGYPGNFKSYYDNNSDHSHTRKSSNTDTTDVEILSEENQLSIRDVEEPLDLTINSRMKTNMDVLDLSKKKPDVADNTDDVMDLDNDQWSCDDMQPEDLTVKSRGRIDDKMVKSLFPTSNRVNHNVANLEIISSSGIGDLSSVNPVQMARNRVTVKPDFVLRSPPRCALTNDPVVANVGIPPYTLTATTTTGNISAQCNNTGGSLPASYLIPGPDISLFSNQVRSKNMELKSNTGTFGNMTAPTFRPLILRHLVSNGFEKDKQNNLSLFDELRKKAEKLQHKLEMNPLEQQPEVIIPGQPFINKTHLKSKDNTLNNIKIKNNKSSNVKLVMKDGVLIAKQKQRRYRTEKPFACSYCSGRFTLRSNMDRHVKQQHPTFWKQRQRGSGRSPRNSNNPRIAKNLVSENSEVEISTIPYDAVSPASQNDSSPNISRLGSQLMEDEIKVEVNTPEEEPDIYNDSIQSDDVDMESNMCAGNDDYEEDDEVDNFCNSIPLKIEINEDIDHPINDESSELIIDEESRLEEEMDMNKNAEQEYSATAEQSEYVERKEENPDLASVRTLLDNVSTQTFSQFFHSEEDRNSRHDDCSEDDEDGLVAGSSSEGNGSCGEENKNNSDTNTSRDGKVLKKKKSAYSTAPNRVHCDFCYRSFPWASSLRRHTLTHTGQKPYKCSSCPLLFTTKSNCDRHFLRKHKSQIPSSDSSAMMVNNTVTNAAVLVSSSSTSVEMNTSLIPTFATRNVPERPFKCTHCPSSTFSTYNNLKKHLSEKHKFSPEDCTRSINDSTAQNHRESNKKEHVAIAKFKTESAETVEISNPNLDRSDVKEIFKNARLQCASPLVDPNNVGAVCVNSSDLPFKCHLCDRSFVERLDALDHIKRIHKIEYDHLILKGALDLNARLEEPFTNEEIQTFNNDDLSDNHRGRFPDYSSRKVICAFCLRRFWSAEDLRRHMRTHTGERPFACDICQRRFTLKHSMLRHRKKHSGKSSGGENSPITDYEDPVSPDSSNGKGFKSDHSCISTIKKEIDLSPTENYPKLLTVTKTPEPSENTITVENDNGKQSIIKNFKLVPFKNQKEDNVDLIAKLLDIEDKSLVDEMLTNKSADDVAKLLGVKKVT